MFNISIWDPLYPQLVEETSIRDRDKQWYLIKQIDGGSSTAKVVAQLDLDAWKTSMLIGYSNNSATLDATITGILPQGWSLKDNTGLTMQRTIEGDYTPLEIVEACRDTYGVYFRFDNVAQTITVVIPDAAAPLGAFATRDLNLKEINYKGKSTDFVTRLYAYGADGLSFASINGGKPYVDNTTYSNKIVCAVWKDDRYTVAENLLEDAKAKLAVMAVPDRSYDCDVVDLRATNPEMYGFLDFEVFSVATLIDDAKGFSINYQVVERWNYPYYPEKNKVIFSSSPAKIQSQVTQIANAISNPNSGFQQQMQAAIGNATNWITNGKGYMVGIKDADGNWMEICSLDTPDISTASNVWRWNNGGFGHSSTGYNGPYTTAITQDGAIVADFITTGTLNAALCSVVNLVADNIKTGTLTAIKIQSEDGSSYWDLAGGGAVFNNDSIQINSKNFVLDSTGNVSITGSFYAQSSTNKVAIQNGAISFSRFNSTVNGFRDTVSVSSAGTTGPIGLVSIYGPDSSGNAVLNAQIQGGNSGGALFICDATGQVKLSASVDGSGNSYIDMGGTGKITTQTLEVGYIKANGQTYRCGWIYNTAIGYNVLCAI